MAVKRRVALPGVAAAEVAAMPVSLVVGVWLGVLRLLAAALVLRRDPIDE